MEKSENQYLKLKNNYKLYLILILISFCDLLYCQTVTIGLKGGINQNGKIINSAQSNNYKNYRQSNEENSVGYNFESTINFKLSNSTSVSMGLGFSTFGYQFAGRIIDPCFSSITCGYNLELKRYTFSFINLPLNINRILFDEKIKLGIGSSFHFPINFKYDWILKNSGEGFLKGKIENSENINFVNKLFIALNISVQFRIIQFQKSNLSFSLNSSIMLTNYENDHIKDKIYSISSFIGQDKTMKETLINFGVAIIYEFQINKI